jgi:agmatine deiminase
MIADWDTSHVFFSDCLEPEEPVLFAGLHAILKGAAIDIIPGARDIWCRDFMPIQLDENRFCQFVYRPAYLRGFEERITPPERCRLPFMECRQEPIVLEGGNVVAARSRVILTDKVYKENPSIERFRLRQRLEELFQAECIFIPKEPFDTVGHADAVVRFISEQRVLINDYASVDPSYGTRLRTVLEKKGLGVETLPLFHEKGNRHPGDLPSAVGIYINYLRVGDGVVIPAYGRPEDEVALTTIRRLLPSATVCQLACRSLAGKGGVLNCISWMIKEKRDNVPGASL